MEEKEADIKISFEHIENPQNLEMVKGVKEILEKEKEKGNLDFKAVIRRKCDYCDKTLTEKDKFTTIKDGNNLLDKCEDCEKRGK